MGGCMREHSNRLTSSLIPRPRVRLTYEVILSCSSPWWLYLLAKQCHLQRQVYFKENLSAQQMFLQTLKLTKKAMTSYGKLVRALREHSVSRNGLDLTLNGPDDHNVILA